MEGAGRARGRARGRGGPVAPITEVRPGGGASAPSDDTSSTSERADSGDGASVMTVTEQLQPMSVMSHRTDAPLPPITIPDCGPNDGADRIEIIANSFTLRKRPAFALYQYHVDFEPCLPNKEMREMMIKQHTDVIGNVMEFDGMGLLFLPIKLGAPVTDLTSVRNTDGSDVNIRVKFVSEVGPDDLSTQLQLYNVIFKRVLKCSDLKCVGRNYYAPGEAVPIPQHKLEVWPGFISSILEFKLSPMLIMDVSHKILHTGTVLQQLYALHKENEHCGLNVFQEKCAKELIGQIVLTRYNNKTYRIDSIDWQCTPCTTFTREDGTKESFVDYFQRLRYDELSADWSRDMKGKKFMGPISLSKWVVVVTQRDRPLAQELVQMMQRICPSTGVQVRDFIPVVLNDDSNQSYLNALRQNVDDSVQIVVCTVPSNRADRYNAIKAYTCIERPVASQVVVAKTLMKSNMLSSVASKIAIQMNCKLGGEIWNLHIPMNDLMVVGLDCYHDSSKKGRSVGAFVASFSKGLTRYYSRCVPQSEQQEIMDTLNVFMSGAIKHYHKHNGNYPGTIIVYRDGVGDGQVQVVSKYEVKQILSSFKTISPDYDPKFSFIIVKKRINSRFFARTNRGITNPPPGTVIDSEVTHPKWYDFFLVSQSVRQGTVSPTHYNVIYDTSNLRPIHQQRLAYKLTHLYYNWPMERRLTESRNDNNSARDSSTESSVRSRSVSMVTNHTLRSRTRSLSNTRSQPEAGKVKRKKRRRVNPFRRTMAPGKKKKKKAKTTYQKLDRSSEEYRDVEERVMKSIRQHAGNMGGRYSTFSVNQILIVKNSRLQKRYNERVETIKLENDQNSNEELLFHGTRAISRILSSGFNVLFASEDSMYGPGLYFAAHASKSNQYVTGLGCRAHHDKSCYLCHRKLLLCDVALGRSIVVYDEEYFDELPDGYHSIHAKARKGGLKFPEFVVFNGASVMVRYVIRYKLVK